MWSYIWPIGLVILSNTVYQICAKKAPEGMNPFAMLTIVYLVSAAFSFVLFFVLNKGGNLIAEYSKINWVPFVFGLVLVGLETGFVYAYKAGWQVNTAQIVQSAFLAAVLIAVGALLFHEAVTWNKIVGVAICVVGLVFVNLK